MADRVLVLRDQHDRRANEQQALEHEDEDVEVGIERDRDGHAHDTPGEHDRGEDSRDGAPGQIASERGTDAANHERRADDQREERR